MTCPALGAAGSGGGRGPSSRCRLRPQVFSRSSHARLLHHLLEGRACALVFPGCERLVHRARERVDSFRPAAGTTPAGQNSGLALRSSLLSPFQASPRAFRPALRILTAYRPPRPDCLACLASQYPETLRRPPHLPCLGCSCIPASWETQFLSSLTRGSLVFRCFEAG